MLKNKLYVYGDSDVYVPANVNFGEYMLHKFMEYKDAVAIIDPATGEKLTYSALAQQTVDVALSLTSIGVRKGDVVSICSEERLEYMPVLLGVMCCGAVFSSTDISGEATIKHRTALTKPTIIFCSPPAFTTYGEILKAEGRSIVVFGRPGVNDEDAISYEDFLTQHAKVEEFQATPVEGWQDPAMMLYSSGTTGLPKAVPLSHLNVLVDMFTLIDADYYKGKIVSTATDFYTFGLSCLHAGATVVFSLKDEAKTVLEAVHKFKVQIVQQMPSTILELVNYPDLDKYDVSSLEHILSASSPLRPELVVEVKRKFPNIKRVCQAYGATEAGVMCSDERAGRGSKPASVGTACPGVVIKVVDVESGKPVGTNERGEICFKSPSVFPGYIGAKTENYLDAEGFYKTGDIGYYDEDRYFFIVDRIKDMIKYRGFAVAPAELESVLLQHPSVAAAAVVGAPDEQFGELPIGFVVLQDGARVNTRELVQFVDEKVAHWMPLAGGVRVIASLPRGNRGKVDKKALRKMIDCY